MKKITHHLGKFYKKTKKSIIVDDKTLFYTFTKVIQEEFGTRGTQMFLPQYFSNGTLVVYVEKSTWAQELWLSRDHIAQMVNKYLSDAVVQKITITSNKNTQF